MEVPFFDLGSQVRIYKEALHECLDNVIDSGQFIGGGYVNNFEETFANKIGVAHCVGVGNGLDALRLCLEVNDIGPGDEVIVPAFTFYATWLAVMQVGATPVPVDVEIVSANLNPDLIEEAITSKTKAIIAVHLYGWAADMTRISNIAREYNLLVFEDAAQSHGALHAGKATGAWGDMAAFSFYPTKNLGALGDAGAVTTNSKALQEKIKSRRSYGQGSSKYDHISIGWNTRLDPLQASFLSYHLTRLDEWTQVRREIASKYMEVISDTSLSYVGPIDVSQSVWHHFVIKIKNRVQVQQWLKNYGVNTDIHYPYAAYKLSPVRNAIPLRYSAINFPVSDELSETVISLPIGPWMSAQQINHVVETLSKLPAD